MTPERAQRARETKKLAKTKRASQEIIVNSDWKITRPDEYNWAIVRKGHENEPWFYGKLLDALQALPHKILDEGQFKDMRDILSLLRGVQQELASLRFYKFEALSDNSAGMMG